MSEPGSRFTAPRPVDPRSVDAERTGEPCDLAPESTRQTAVTDV